MWKKKIRQRKGQFLLIGTILMVVALIFAVAIDFASGVVEYNDRYYSRDNINDVVVQSYSKEATSKVIKFIDEKEENLKEYRKVEALNFDLNIYHDSKNLELNLVNLIRCKDKGDLPWDIVIREGEEGSSPKEGTIWLNVLLAELNGIEIGDTIKIKDGDVYRGFIVDALVNDALFPNTTIGIHPFYINEKDFDTFKNRLELDFIGYNTSKTGKELAKSLKENVPNGIFHLERDTIKMASNTTSLISSGISICMSIIIIIAAALIIRFIVMKNIYNEYKSIGIYKTMGLTSRDIKMIYFKSYGLVSIVSICIGAIMSSFFSEYLIEMSVKYIGDFTGIKFRLGSVLIAIAVISLISILNLYIVLRRIDKIKPIEAFKTGVTSSKHKFKKSLIKNAVSPISTGINDIFKNKKQNIMILLILSMVMYMSTFIYTANYSINHMSENASKGFGVLTGDAVVELPSGSKEFDEIKEELEKDKDVKTVRLNSFETKGLVSLDNSLLITMISNDFTAEDGFKCEIIEGRNPIDKDEVAVSTQILKDKNLKVGDYIKLSINNEERKFFVSGSYSGMLNNGSHVRILSSAIPKGKLLDKGFVVTLNSDFDSFKEKYKDKYESISIGKRPKVLESALESVVVVVRPVTALIMVGTMIFSLLNIINLMIMNSNENRRKFAIMKSLGFSTNYIIIRTLCRVSILAIISTMIGAALNILFTEEFFKVAMNGVNIIQIPYLEMNLIAIVIASSTIIASYLSIRNIKNISAVELMEE